MTGSRPNIVLFLTDDHARWGLPTYGNPVVRAPNIQRLAARGTVYEDAYTTSPVCSPARASLMTGLMPSQHGVHDFLASNPEFDGHDWLEGLPTLAKSLSAAGYRCGLVGKWHIGRDSTPAPGFEFWQALNGEYPIHHDGDNGFSHDGAQGRTVGNLTDAITAQALRFLAEDDGKRPYFLVVGYYATHSPWQDQPQRLVQSYAGGDFSELETPGSVAPGALNPELTEMDAASRRSARQNYYAAITHIDEGVGAVMDAARGQETLAVYTSDHGLSLGQNGLWGKGNATRPQNLLDEHIRVPLIMAGPEIAVGHRQAGLFDHIDTHSAILRAAGLDGGGPRPPRTMQFCEYGTQRMVRTAAYKLVTWTTGAPSRLYVVGPHGPETEIQAAGSAALVAELEKAVRDFFAAHTDPARSGPEALLPGRFNYNQAWDPFVPRGRSASVHPAGHRAGREGQR